MNKKFILIVLVSIVLIILISLFASLRPKTSKFSLSDGQSVQTKVTQFKSKTIQEIIEESGDIKKSGNVPKKMTGLAISRDSVQFARAQKRPDGSYFTSLVCTKAGDKGTCQSTSIQTFFAGMYINYLEELAAATKDNRYQNEAEENMKWVMNKCESDLQFCEWVFFPLFSRYNRTKDVRYLDYMIKVGGKLFTSESTNTNVFILETKKFIMLYMATGEQKYLDEALRRKNKVEEVAARDAINPVAYTVAGRSVRQNDCERYWGIELDLYKATKNKEFLLEAKRFYDEVRIGDHGPDFANLSSIATCMEGLLSLESATEDKSYRAQAVSLASYGVKNFWDSPYAPKFNSDYGFLVLPATSEKNKILNNKYFTEHVWMSRMLLRLANNEFEL